MTDYSKTICSLFQFGSIIRDSMDYALTPEGHKAEIYNIRKTAINNFLNNVTPISVCIKNSGEAGKKLDDAIKDFIDFLYSDNSTVVKVSKDDCIVDDGQLITLMEKIVPLYEEINNVIKSHFSAAQKNKQFEQKVVDVYGATEYMYRGYCYIILVNLLDKRFAEYNKARQEAKGEITPQSNFINGEINRIIKTINFVRSTAGITTLDYYEVVDPVFVLIENVQGRRALKEGQNFGQLFTDVKKLSAEHVEVWRKRFIELYTALMDEFTKSITPNKNEAQA